MVLLLILLLPHHYYGKIKFSTRKFQHSKQLSGKINLSATLKPVPTSTETLLKVRTQEHCSSVTVSLIQFCRFRKH